MNKLLFFHADLGASSKLIDGRLLLIDKDADKVDAQFIAASGAVGAQSWESQSRRGAGPIPRCDLVGLDHYIVSTAPINLKHIRGIEGNFYKIDPHFVQIEGKQRGDFGIHFDANVPGSAGCIVIKNAHAWAEFQKMMSHYRAAGIKKIPLIVSYVR